MRLGFFAFLTSMLPSAASPSRRASDLVAEGGLISSPLLVLNHSEEFPMLEKVGSVPSVVSMERVSSQHAEKTQEFFSSNQTEVGKVVKKSFLHAAQQRVFTQQKFEVVEVDGCQKVVVPKGVFVGAKLLWEDFIIGKLLNVKAPHVGKVHMIVNKIWRLGDRSSIIDVFAVDDSTIKFRIRNEGMRKRILNRGMWNIADIPMIVSKWTPFAEEAQPAMKSIPLWVTLSNIPPSMFTDKGLEFLASAVGKPIRLHPKTESCSSFDEAQFLVEADLMRDLPKEYVITGEEEGEVDSVIQYSYPWLPPRCSGCKKWGHLHTTCLSVVAGDFPATSLSTPVLEEKVATPTHLAPVVAEKNPESEKRSETMSLISETVVEQVLDKEEGDGWIITKSRRSSPGKHHDSVRSEEVSLLSNQYSVLEDEQDKGVEKTEVVQEAIPMIDLEPAQLDQSVSASQDTTSQSRVPKDEMPLRQSLPRGSKTAHKTIPPPAVSSTRDLSRTQHKKLLPKRS